MFFLTRPQHEFDNSLVREFFGEDIDDDNDKDTQQFSLVQWSAIHDYWFIVEQLALDNIGEGRCRSWRTTNCTEVEQVLELASMGTREESRISLIISPGASARDRIEIKLVTEISVDDPYFYRAMVRTDDGVSHEVQSSDELKLFGSGRLY